MVCFSIFAQNTCDNSKNNENHIFLLIGYVV